ncbi:MAG: hypothetical protein RLZZ272_1667 [Actinomycetota bacterium]|jgi:predicted O-methyltransferase YrrM
MTPRGWPDGHFYSPVPSDEDIDRSHRQRRQSVGRTFPGIDIDSRRMLRLAIRLRRAVGDHRLASLPGAGRRYGYDDPNNGQFGRADAALLTAMLAHLRPRRIIEVGSGFSTAVMLDVVEAFSLPTRITTIDPFPERLRAVMGAEDDERLEVIEAPVQDVGTEPFRGLRRRDVLFIDSSHVAKSGSDVVHELLEVVPRLAPGVHLHVHDIFPGFDYPRPWLEEGRYWNEAFLLRALLIHNRRLRVTLWPACLPPDERARLAEALPLLGERNGGSIWMRTH